MGRTWSLVPLLGMAALCACSPYVYNQEITGFGTGVDAVVASYQTGRQAVDTIVAAQRQADYAGGRKRLLLLPGCDQTDPDGTPPRLADCDVVAFSAPSAPPPAPVQQNLVDAASAFNALKAYAAALTAVTDAADETALNLATQSLTTAASGMAGAVAKRRPDAAKASARVAPASGLLGLGVTLWLDQRRLAALRDTVPMVDPSVQMVGQTVQAALAAIRAQQLLQLGSEVRRDAEPFEVSAVGRLGLGDYQSRLAVLWDRIAAFNQARAADPAAVVTGMMNAHHQLALALQGNAGPATTVQTGVQAFVAAAEKLTAAMPAPTAAAATASKVARRK